MPDKLSTYYAKRNFRITPEPRGTIAEPSERLRFVVQKHDASKLHYDFRLEFDGTLKSWAIPKGPSFDPSQKRLAVHVEDHPLDYIDFEGDIPDEQYGAGHVDVWDIGYWEPQGDPAEAYKAGKLKFRLDGEKLHGGWTLVRTRLQANSGKEQWLLIKEKDDTARAASEFDVTAALPHSVLSPPAAASQPTKQTTRGKRADSSEAIDRPQVSTKTARRKTPGSGIAAPALPTSLPHAKKAALPDMLAPQLATLVDAVPEGGDWLYEIKFDGYRVLARIDNGDVRLFTRDGKDWTAKLPQQVKALSSLGIANAWLDGEIVVLDEHDMPSFQLLQNAFDKKKPANIIYFLFDVPYLNGYDLRDVPLTARRTALEHILAQAPMENLRYSAAMQEHPQQLLDSACNLSMEGIIGKRADAPYVGKRNADWIKLKCRKRQEFVIAGYTEPQGARQFFGALLLGVYDDDGKLRYAGRVGTGFDREILQSVHRQLHQREQARNPFAHMPGTIRRAETHWVKPQLVAEVSFSEWTRDGLVRQAVFHGLRTDKPARQVRREDAVSTPGNATQKSPVAPLGAATPARKSRSASPRTMQGIAITHPERVIDPASKRTKLDLARYYEHVAPHILPFLINRPVYLLRCPEGIEGERFFQKHLGRAEIAGVTPLDPSLDPGRAPLMAIESPQALIGAVQMGTVELHGCSAGADRIDRPDCMVFDLDPDPSLPWKSVVEGARLTKVLLDELGLVSFLKTSGSKGLHLVVPLARRHEWDDVTAFSQAVAEHLAQTIPALFSAKMGEQNRVGKIFIDYMRNRRYSSTVTPYSVRARPGLPVATPIAWEELQHVTSSAMWTVATLPERLAGLTQDPWQDYASTRQLLTATMKKMIGVKPMKK